MIHTLPSTESICKLLETVVQLDNCLLLQLDRETADFLLTQIPSPGSFFSTFMLF